MPAAERTWRTQVERAVLRPVSDGPAVLKVFKRVGVSVRQCVWEKKAEAALLRSLEAPGGGPLDTLGQVGTKPVNTADNQPQRKALEKRARGKFFTQAVVLGLIDVERARIEAGEAAPLRRQLKKRKDAMPGADAKGMIPTYWRAYHCGGELRKEGGKLVTTLCRCRCCTVCMKIETARLIKRYLPVLNTFDEKWFVTLTPPNVPADKLPAMIARMKRVFNTIRERIKKQYQRGQRATALRALRKLECTVNLRRWDFHPHFHIITDSEEVANYLVSEWLRHFPEANRKGQDVRQADDNSVMELFKYFAKLTASGGKDGGTKYIPAEALNIIFTAVAGERVFQAFNMKAGPVEPEAVATEPELVELELARGERWLWNRELNDWVEHSTGELLTGYVPSDALRDLVERRILRTRHRPRPTRPAAPPNTT